MDFRQQPNKDHGVGHEPWRSSQISSETNESESRRGLTAAAPHRSRHDDRVWFTGVKHVTLSQSQMTHMETLLSQHYENQTTKKKYSVWTECGHKTKGKCTHRVQWPCRALQCDNWHVPLLQNETLDFFCLTSLQTTRMLSLWEPADLQTHQQLHRNTWGDEPPLAEVVSVVSVLSISFFIFLFAWQPLNVEQQKPVRGSLPWTSVFSSAAFLWKTGASAGCVRYHMLFTKSPLRPWTSLHSLRWNGCLCFVIVRLVIPIKYIVLKTHAHTNNIVLTDTYQAIKQLTSQSTV